MTYEFSGVVIEGVSDDRTLTQLEETIGWSAGKKYSEHELYRLMQLIQLSGQYRHIEFSFESNAPGSLDKLVIDLAPRRIISRIRLSKEENIRDQHLKQHIQQFLASFVGQQANIPIRDRLSQEVQRLMQQQGYFQTQIFVNRFILDDRSEEFEVHIELGEQLKMSSVKVLRHLPYKKADILKRMSLKLDHPLNHLAIQKATSHYEEELQAQDFPYARLIMEYHPHPNNKSVDIVIDLQKGPKRHTHIRGAYHLAHQQIRHILDSFLESQVEAQSESIEKRVRQLYQPLGFDQVRVRTQIRRHSQREDILIDIHEGLRTQIVGILWEGLPTGLRPIFEKRASGWMTEAAYRSESLVSLSRADLAQRVFSSDQSRKRPTAHTRQTHPWYTNGLEAHLQKRVLAELKSHGYLDARIHSLSTFSTHIPGQVQFRCQIEAGHHFEVERIRFVPETSPSIHAFSQHILKAHRIHPGSDFDSTKLEHIRTQLNDRLLELGYATADVEMIWSREADQSIPVTYFISPGPRIQIARIFFRGLEQTQQWTVEHLVDIERGDWLTQKKLNASRRALLRTGLFSTVRIKHVPIYGEPDQHDVIINIRERKKYTLEVGGGLSIEDGPRMYIQNETRHIFNTPTTSSTRFQINYPAATFDLVYQPDAPNHPRRRFDDVSPGWRWSNFLEGQLHSGLSWNSIPQLSVDTDLFVNVIGLKEIRPAYNLIRGSIRGGLSLKWFSFWTSNVELEFEGSRFECPDGSEADQLGCGSVVSRQLERTETGQIQQLTLHLSHAFDFRDDRFHSQKGLWFRTNLALARGQGYLNQNDGARAPVEPDYIRLDVNLFNFIPLHTNWKLIFNTRGGHIFRIGDIDNFYVPLYKRFYLGGTNSIRGFFQDELLPVDLPDWPGNQRLPSDSALSLINSRTSLGGNSYLLWRSEVQRQLSPDMYLATFFDIGSLALNFDQIALNTAAAGIGAGIRLKTPLGPLALDIGYQLRDGVRQIAAPISLSRLNLHLALGYY